GSGDGDGQRGPPALRGLVGLRLRDQVRVDLAGGQYAELAAGLRLRVAEGDQAGPVGDLDRLTGLLDGGRGRVGGHRRGVHRRALGQVVEFAEGAPLREVDGVAGHALKAVVLDDGGRSADADGSGE